MHCDDLLKSTSRPRDRDRLEGRGARGLRIRWHYRTEEDVVPGPGWTAAPRGYLTYVTGRGCGLFTGGNAPTWTSVTLAGQGRAAGDPNESETDVGPRTSSAWSDHEKSVFPIPNSSPACNKD